VITSLNRMDAMKAKLSLEFIQSLNHRRDGKLILVAAISPTPAGEGKTTTAIDLFDPVNRVRQENPHLPPRAFA